MNAHQLARLQTSSTARIVMTYLLRRPRSLPSWFVREAASRDLQAEVTRLREQALVPLERALVAAHATELVGLMSPRATLVELGADGRDRARPLVEALLARAGATGLGYVPAQADDAELVAASLALRASSPRLEVMPLRAELLQSPHVLARVAGPRLVFVPCGRLAPVSPVDAATWLRSLRAVSSPDDMLLLGVDQRVDAASLASELDDALTARFNMGVLERLGHELGADFDRQAWRHEVRWNGSASRSELHLVARSRQPVFVDALGLPLLFEAGESIHTESRQQYPEPLTDRLLFAGGWAREASFSGAGDEVALVLARPQ